MSWRSTELSWLRLGWPRQVQPEQLGAVFALLASSTRGPVVLQAVGTPSGVDHYLALPSSRSDLIAEHLRAVMPGISTRGVEHPGNDETVVSRAVKLRLSSRRRPLRTDDPEQVIRALLTALAHVGRREQLVLQWILGPVLSPRVVPSRLTTDQAESVRQALHAPWRGAAPLDGEARSALREKQGEPGWRAIGRIAVRAAGVPRQRQLLSQVLGALRAAQAPGVSLLGSRENPARVSSAVMPWRWPLVINGGEARALSSWPVGETSGLPVRRVGSRPLPPNRAIPTKGRVIGESTWPGGERTLALSPEDSLRHLHVLGPTGVGKSTLLLNLIVQDMNAGRGVVVIEPKGDLIDDVLRRVPDHRVGDVVLLDPTDNVCPVGLNPLAADGRSPELVADQLLAVFHGLYAAHWGPRTQDILHASLLTLARVPGTTLVGLPLLLSDPSFRRRMVGKLHDPLALAPFWAAFEAWSEAERTAAVAPVMNKLRPFILRPQLRRVIGQARPRFDVRQVFTQRKLLLVNLSKGQLGPEGSALLGSLVVAALWQATLERSRTRPERRHPVMLFIDEFQDYLHLPTDLSHALAEARGLGVGLTLAHQHLHQLEPTMRSAVLANARSRVCFQLPTEDARHLAGVGNHVEAEDFQSLGRYEVYAALTAQGTVQPWCSARTMGPINETTKPAFIRAASGEGYGLPTQQIERDLEQLVIGSRRIDRDDLSPRKRSIGGRP